MWKWIVSMLVMVLVAGMFTSTAMASDPTDVAPFVVLPSAYLNLDNALSELTLGDVNPYGIPAILKFNDNDYPDWVITPGNSICRKGSSLGVLVSGFYTDLIGSGAITLGNVPGIKYLPDIAGNLSS